VGLTPSVAYRVDDDLSFGAGVAAIYTVFDEKIAINNPGSEADGQVHMDDLDDWGYQPFVGLTYRLNERALFGAVYRAEMEVDLEGDIKITDLGPIAAVDGDLKVSWDNAQTVEIGLQYQLDDVSYLFLVADWEDWSVFDDNVLTIGTGGAVATLERNWKDTWMFGATYARFLGKDVVTVGASYVSSPVDDDDRAFDLPFDESYRFAASYVWNPSPELQYSLGGQLMLFGDAPVDQTVQGVRAAGDFDENYIIAVTGSLTYRF